MKKKQLVVEVRARFDYLEPPRDRQEASFREQERHRIGALAKSLEPAIQASIRKTLSAVGQLGDEDGADG